VVAKLWDKSIKYDHIDAISKRTPVLPGSMRLARKFNHRRLWL
jgi:hypothetical protein